MSRVSSRILALILLACFAMPSLASAQIISTGQETQSITVTGYGLSSRPAETATLQIVFTTDDYYSGPPQVPQVEATPGASVRSSMEPIVAAIEAHDVVDSVTVVVPAPIGSLGRPAGIARLDIEINGPTQEGLIALVNDAARAAGEDRMVIGYVGAFFSVADCQPLEEEARQAALADAQRQAEIQATALDTTLGEVTATIDIDPDATLTPGYYGLLSTSNNSCTAPLPMSSRTSFDFGVTTPVFDPVSSAPLVEVYREIQVTYATSA
jgi:hypothetical protein